VNVQRASALNELNGFELLLLLFIYGSCMHAGWEPSSAAAGTGAASPRRVSKCAHIACCYSSVCIVEQLEVSLKGYVRGRGADTFRMFNTRRAIGTIASASSPLKTEEDVDKLPLGAQHAV
jgi:hypothetical protein